MRRFAMDFAWILIGFRRFSMDCAADVPRFRTDSVKRLKYQRSRLWLVDGQGLIHISCIKNLDPSTISDQS